MLQVRRLHTTAHSSLLTGHFSLVSYLVNSQTLAVLAGVRASASAMNVANGGQK